MGSIPAGGARKTTCFDRSFFQRNKSLAGFVKLPSAVKYASCVKCAAACEGIYFISLDALASNFTIYEVNDFAKII